MKVFEFFTYNLKDVKFKNNKSYFDDFLKELDLNYTDIMFCFKSDFSGNVCKKIIKIFPQLSEYVQHLEESVCYFKSAPEYCFSSIKINGGQEQMVRYIKEEHKDEFSALIKKIPNTINFGCMGVILDNINWYKEEFHRPFFYSNCQEINYYNHQFSSYYSNSIRFFKEMDFGNKLNLVQVVIERKVFEDDLEPYSNTFREVLLKLGIPTHSRLECVFSKAEKEEWLNASKKFRCFIEEKGDEKKAFQNINHLGIDKEYLTDSVTPVSGFSPKTIFNKIAKAKGFKCCFGKNGCHRYQLKNLYEHTFIVELMNIPFSSFFEASISVEGYNFTHTLYATQRTTLKNSTEAELFAEEVFNIAIKAKNDYSEELLFLYGHTPKWYTKQ